MKAPTAQYTYTFDGWTPEPAAVTGETVYTARFRQSVNSYGVIWRNEDGTELQRGEAEYGTVPAYTGSEPVKAPTAQYTYTFDGWTPTPAAVTGETVYTARFRQTVNSYAVIWHNWDGTELQRGEAEYGTVPVYTGEEPVKAADAEYTYVFDGWTPTPAEVTGEALYTARFRAIPVTAETCIVTWQNEDGTELRRSVTECGTVPVYTGETPVKAADAEYTYIFDGWTPEPAEVTEDTVYTARFRAEPLPAVPVTQITLVSIEGAAEGQPIPAGDFTLAVTVELAEGIAPETVQILAAAYSEAGQFLGCFEGILTRQADGSCAASVDVQGRGDTARLHILVLSGAGWIPLAAAAELR